MLGSSAGVSSQKNLSWLAHAYSSPFCTLHLMRQSSVSQQSSCCSRRVSYFWRRDGLLVEIWFRSVGRLRMSSAVSFRMTLRNCASESGVSCWLSMEMAVQWLKSTRLTARRCWMLYCSVSPLRLFSTALYLQLLSARLCISEVVSTIRNRICSTSEFIEIAFLTSRSPSSVTSALMRSPSNSREAMAGARRAAAWVRAWGVGSVMRRRTSWSSKRQKLGKMRRWSRRMARMLSSTRCRLLVSSWNLSSRAGSRSLARRTPASAPLLSMGLLICLQMRSAFSQKLQSGSFLMSSSRHCFSTSTSLSCSPSHSSSDSCAMESDSQLIEYCLRACACGFSSIQATPTRISSTSDRRAAPLAITVNLPSTRTLAVSPTHFSSSSWYSLCSLASTLLFSKIACSSRALAPTPLLRKSATENSRFLRSSGNLSGRMSQMSAQWFSESGSENPSRRGRCTWYSRTALRRCCSTSLGGSWLSSLTPVSKQPCTVPISGSRVSAFACRGCCSAAKASHSWRVFQSCWRLAICRWSSSSSVQSRAGSLRAAMQRSQLARVAATARWRAWRAARSRRRGGRGESRRRKCGCSTCSRARAMSFMRAGRWYFWTSLVQRSALRSMFCSAASRSWSSWSLSLSVTVSKSLRRRVSMRNCCMVWQTCASSLHSSRQSPNCPSISRMFPTVRTQSSMFRISSRSLLPQLPSHSFSRPVRSSTSSGSRPLNPSSTPASRCPTTPFTRVSCTLNTPSSTRCGNSLLIRSSCRVLQTRNCSKVSAGFSRAGCSSFSWGSCEYCQQAWRGAVRRERTVSVRRASVVLRTALRRARAGSRESRSCRGSRLSFSLISQLSLTRSSHSSRMLTYFCISRCRAHLSKHLRAPSPSRRRKPSQSSTSSTPGCRESQYSQSLATWSLGPAGSPLRRISLEGSHYYN